MDYTIITALPQQSPQSPKAFHLIFAENGTLHEYPLAKFISPLSAKEPYALMDFIEKEFSIPTGDQVILRAVDGKQLELSMNLREFFEKDQVIHVFDKRFYREETISDDFEVINSLSPRKNDWGELKLDYLPEIYEAYSQIDTKTYLDQSLLGKGEEVTTTFCDVSNEIKSLKEASIKLKRQKDSESVAKKNLMGYYVEKKKKFDETFVQMKNKFRNFQVLFDEFESYLVNLSKIEINPQLAERGKKFLIDYLDVGKVKSNKAAYEKNQSKIILKCNEIEKEILEYDDHLKKMEEDIPDYYFEIICLIQEQEIVFGEVHNKSLQRVQELMLKDKEPMFTVHLNKFVTQEWEMTLPKLRSIFQSLQAVRSKLEDHLKDNSMKLKGFVSDVANIQIVIREKLQNRHTVFRSLVEKHEKDIFSLKAIADFPIVYQASVEEIQRRYRSKEDCLTVLNILENFTNAENSMRQEFMKRYSAYLPKSFCPMLFKGFPQINFEYLQKVINEDESFSLNEGLSRSSNNNEHGKILQLLKTFSNNAQDKEFRIQELQDMLRIQAENLNKFRAQLKSKTVEASDLSELLEKSGFQDQMNSMVDSLNEKYKGQIKVLEEKLEKLQTSRIEPFEAYMKQIKEEVNEQLGDTEGKSVVEVIREARLEFERNMCKLTRQLEEKRAEKQKIIDHLETMEEKMEKLSLEIKQAREEKAELKELSRALSEKMNEKEIVEASLREMVAKLKESLESDQDTIVSLGRDLNEKEKENENLTQEIESLTRLHHVATGIIREKEEVVDECKNQLMMLWEGLAEKENEIYSMQNLVETFKKEMNFLRLQNEKLEELMKNKDALLAEMHVKVESQQMRVLVFQDILTAKGQEVTEMEDSLSLCRDELEKLASEKNSIEKDLESLRQENESVKNEKAGLLTLIQQTRENWKECEESRKDLQYTLRKRGVQIEVLEVEKRRLMEALEVVKKEKAKLKETMETITQEVSAQFSSNMKRLEDHLKVRDQEVELLQEIVLKNMPPEVEKLANEEEGKERSMKSESSQVEKEESRDKDHKDMSTSCESSLSEISCRLLGEFGEFVLKLYTTLLGKDGESMIASRCFDLQEIMSEIPKLIKNSTVKVQDLVEGDQVLGMKVLGSNNVYQLVLKDGATLNASHAYLAERDYGEMISGSIENLENVKIGEDNYGLFYPLKSDVIVNVKLMNVVAVSSVPRLNL